MDETTWFDARHSRADVWLGFGGTLLVHLAIAVVAGLTPMLAAPTPVVLPSYQVKLVSAGELGAAAPREGGQAARKEDPAARSKAVKSQNIPVMPVKRLQVAEKPSAQVSLSKTESKVQVPAVEASVPALAKSVEALVPKSEAKAPPQPVRGHKERDGEEEKALEAVAGAPERTAGSGSKPGATSGTPGGSGSGATSGAATGVDAEEVGLAQRLYYTEVWNAIRRQWALPTMLRSSSLEAVIVLVIRRDGQILETHFEKRSGNEAFDETALRAVKKANPLPPFPSIFSPRQVDIGVRFSPKDL